MKKHQSESLNFSLRWPYQAEADFDAAQDSLKSEHFEWACFQAQQAAEKSLKAFLFSRGLRAVITHSTAELLIEAQKYAKTLDSIYPQDIPMDYLERAFQHVITRRRMLIYV